MFSVACAKQKLKRKEWNGWVKRSLAYLFICLCFFYLFITVWFHWCKAHKKDRIFWGMNMFVSSIDFFHTVCTNSCLSSRFKVYCIYRYLVYLAKGSIWFTVSSEKQITNSKRHASPTNTDTSYTYSIYKADSSRNEWHLKLISLALW